MCPTIRLLARLHARRRQRWAVTASRAATALMATATLASRPPPPLGLMDRGLTRPTPTPIPTPAHSLQHSSSSSSSSRAATVPLTKASSSWGSTLTQGSSNSSYSLAGSTLTQGSSSSSSSYSLAGSTRKCTRLRGLRCLSYSLLGSTAGHYSHRSSSSSGSSCNSCGPTGNAISSPARASHVGALGSPCLTCWRTRQPVPCVGGGMQPCRAGGACSA